MVIDTAGNTTYVYVGEDCYYYKTNSNNDINKLGLMYLSDYFYASENCENKIVQEANILSGSIESGYTDTSTVDIRACNNTNWLYNLKKSEWLLTQVTANAYDSAMRYSDGVIYTQTSVDAAYNIRPVLYLTSSVKITGGSGTSTNPYTLGL